MSRNRRHVRPEDFGSLRDEFDKILLNLRLVLEQLDDEAFLALLTRIADTPHIFLAGMGRSGHVARSFAVRLTQLGKMCYVVFEATSPSVSRGDLLLICSGSGSTSTMVTIAEKAKRAGAELAVITGNPLSPLGRMADIRVTLPPVLPPSLEREQEVLQPLQTLFEQSLLVVLDAMTLNLMRVMDVDEATMRARHSDLE